MATKAEFMTFVGPSFVPQYRRAPRLTLEHGTCSQCGICPAGSEGLCFVCYAEVTEESRRALATSGAKAAN